MKIKTLTNEWDVKEAVRRYGCTLYDRDGKEYRFYDYDLALADARLLSEEQGFLCSLWCEGVRIY